MQSFIDHLSVGVSDLDDAQRFYDRALATIGVKRLAATDSFIAYGKDAPQFLVMLPYDRQAARAGNGVHISFTAATHAEVDLFYKTALALGGECAGAPGTRAGFPGDPDAYMAFVRDPFGNKLEAIANGFAV
ncbi:MAG: VOC family protein [Rhodomicrobium sp.]|nr:VOC family protein [Rhodomicrobium sp.]